MDPDSNISPRAVANITVESRAVIEAGFMQTSRVMGCPGKYVPVSETFKAHTPSVVKAYSGNCPN